MVLNLYFYNIVVHNIVASSIKDVAYEDKINRSVIYLLVAGVFATVVSNKIKKSKDHSNKGLILSKGLWYGGLLLLISPLFVVWTGINNDLKQILMMLSLGIIVWWTNNNQN